MARIKIELEFNLIEKREDRDDEYVYHDNQVDELGILLKNLLWAKWNRHALIEGLPVYPSVIRDKEGNAIGMFQIESPLGPTYEECGYHELYEEVNNNDNY